jgi:hypothetical protein
LIEHIKAVGEPEFRREVRSRCEAFIADLDLPHDADPVVRRVAQVFALTAVAGEFSADFQVIDIPAKQLKSGVSKCFKGWLKDRGSVTKTAAQRAVVVALRDFISTNRPAFLDLDADPEDWRPTGKVIGYTKKIEGVLCYLFTRDTWREVESKAKRGGLLKQLEELKLLKSNEARRKTYKTVIEDQAGRLVRERLYAVSSDIAELDDSGEFRSEIQFKVRKNGEDVNHYAETFDEVRETKVAEERAKKRKTTRAYEKMLGVPKAVAADARKRKRQKDRTERRRHH